MKGGKKMQDDVGAEIVIRRTRQNLPPLDAEEIDGADLDGWCDAIYAEGIGMVYVGIDADPIAALEELHEGEGLGDNDVASLAREFGAPVLIDGMPVDPDVDEAVVLEIADLGKPASPFEIMDVLPGPHDRDAKIRAQVCEARQEHGCDKWSMIHKMDDQKRPGRRKKRRVVRAIKQGRLAA